MAAIIQTTFSNGFSWVRMYEFRLSFHWSFFLGGTINIIPALAQTMPWCRPGDKPLSEPVAVSLLMRICIARPQWVKYDYNLLILDDNKNGKPIGLQFTTREGIFKHWNSMVLRQDDWRCDGIFINESLYHFQVLQKFLLRVTKHHY